MADIFERMPLAHETAARKKYKQAEREGQLKDRGFRSLWFLNQFVPLHRSYESFLPVGRIAGRFLPFLHNSLADDTEPFARLQLASLPVFGDREPTHAEQNLQFYMIPLPSKLSLAV
jgi:hypothetical protein